MKIKIYYQCVNFTHEIDTKEDLEKFKKWMRKKIGRRFTIYHPNSNMEVDIFKKHILRVEYYED